MQKNKRAHVASQEQAVVNPNLTEEMHNVKKEKLASYINRHKRFGIILLGILALNAVYGFDVRFTIINLLWILISVIKIK